MFKSLDIFLFLALILTVFAQEVVPPNIDFAFTPSVIVSGILTILVGSLMLLFGYRMLKFLLFCAGFFVFSIIGYTILTKTNAGSGSPTVLLYGSLAIGLVGGILAVLLYRLGISLLGALGGMTLALWINSLKAGGVLADKTQLTIFIIVFAVIGAIVIHFAEKIVIILCSSFAGAYSICYGIDTFTHFGYAGRLRDAYNSGVNYSQLHIEFQEVGWQLSLLLAANILLFLGGAWFQFRTNRDRNHSKAAV